jgi:hypothetical protein
MGTHIYCGNPSPAQRPWRPRGQDVEVVYHRFPSDGPSKSIGASQLLKCGAPEEQVGKHALKSMWKHALKSMLQHSFKALLVRVYRESAHATDSVGDVIPTGGTSLWIHLKLFFVWFNSNILYV